LLPEGKAVDTNKSIMYVANANLGKISVITLNGQILKSISTDSTPSLQNVAVDGKTHTIYIVKSNSHTVYVVDGANVKPTARITQVGLKPYGIALDTARNKVYVSNAGSNTVSVIDGKANTVIKNITVGSVPIGSYMVQTLIQTLYQL
jgi:YVTN family beta-propeller protein